MKKLTSFLRDELARLGWKANGQGMRDGYAYVKDGIQIVIVPSKNMPNMYHVTKEKMSESESMFLHTTSLLDFIETEGDR